MLPYYLLFAAATLSHAYFYPAEGGFAPSMVKSRLFRRKLGEAAVCAPKSVADNIKYQALNTTDIAMAENMLMSWAQDPNSVLQNTGGSKGQVVTSGTIDAQACNYAHNPQHINAADLKTLFGTIPCGGYYQPQMGFGFAG
jgi:hypothetical protein